MRREGPASKACVPCFILARWRSILWLCGGGQAWPGVRTSINVINLSCAIVCAGVLSNILQMSCPINPRRGAQAGGGLVALARQAGIAVSVFW